MDSYLPPRFDESQRKLMLDLARRAIETHLESHSVISHPPEDFLQELTGAFVSLHLQDTLRGCIGSVEPRFSLGQTIIRCAVSAAFHDPRFDPIRKEELDQAEIEISILSRLQKIESVEEIRIGAHGIMMTSRHHRGLLLPQVAVQQQWDRETFLSHTCYKAGLDPEAWKRPDTYIEIFSAEVFGEKT